jgi:hypothetical protein
MLIYQHPFFMFIGHASKQGQRLAVALSGIRGIAFYRSCGITLHQ